MLTVYYNKYIKNVPANKLVVLQTLQKIYIFFNVNVIYVFKNGKISLMIGN